MPDTSAPPVTITWIGDVDGFVRLLDQTLRRRAHLVSMRVALMATTEELQGLEAERQAAVEHLSLLIAALETRLKQLLEASQAQQQAVQRLRGIPGVGLIVSAALVAALQRLPFPTADAFVAYTGLDPRPCDSGKKIGRSDHTRQALARAFSEYVRNYVATHKEDLSMEEVGKRAAAQHKG